MQSDPSMTWLPATLSLGAGLTVGAFGFHFTGDSPRIFQYWPVTGIFAGLLLGGVFPRRAWLWAVVFEAGVQGGCLAAMIPDWLKDPTSNNLWPLALALIGVLSLPPTFVGIGIGWLFRRWTASSD